QSSNKKVRGRLSPGAGRGFSYQPLPLASSHHIEVPWAAFEREPHDAGRRNFAPVAAGTGSTRKACSALDAASRDDPPLSHSQMVRRFSASTPLPVDVQDS